MGVWYRSASALLREQGQALTEYALVISLLVGVAAAVIAATGVGSMIAEQISKQIGNVL